MARYIDAETLKERMFNYYECVNENTGKSNYTGETLMNYEVADMIEDCIDNAPTEDVVPRSEVENIFKEFEKLVIEIRYNADYTIFDMQKDFAELRKKHIGEEK